MSGPSADSIALHDFHDLYVSLLDLGVKELELAVQFGIVRKAPFEEVAVWIEDSHGAVPKHEGEVVHHERDGLNGGSLALVTIDLLEADGECSDQIAMGFRRHDLLLGHRKLRRLRISRLGHFWLLFAELRQVLHSDLGVDRLCLGHDFSRCCQRLGDLWQKLV